jgi:hypothetical protein
LTNYAAILKKENKLELVEAKADNLIAEIYYHDTLLTKGWDKLSIKGYNQDNPLLQTYIAGYLEGRLTHKDITNFITNVNANYRKNGSGAFHLDKIKTFFSGVNKYIIDNIDKFSQLSEDDKDYYYKIYIFYSQIHGLLRGVNYERERNQLPPYTLEELVLIQADGELQELISK